MAALGEGRFFYGLPWPVIDGTVDIRQALETRSGRSNELCNADRFATYNKSDASTMLNECLTILRSSLQRCFAEQAPSIQATWKLSGRAVSEIGGRLIESFVLARLPHELSIVPFDGAIRCDIPASGRAMEDIAVIFESGQRRVRLLVDVKGHNEYRAGSRPNLASIRKCVDLYESSDQASDELVVFFCRYKPSVHPDHYAESVAYEVLPESFSERGVFLLRSLSEANMDPANIGSGGQLLLAREDRIELVDRPREKFVIYLKALQGRLAERRLPSMPP